MNSRILVLIFVSFLFVACTSTDTLNENHQTPAPENIEYPPFQTILDSMELMGTILIYDANSTTYYSNDFNWSNKGFLPASTFKIANGLIALETGVVPHDSLVFKWDGTDRYLDAWEQDLPFSQAFKLSCVPCFQEIARNIGVDRMNKYIQKLQYGQIIVDTTNLDNFWLRGQAQISPMQQVHFLERLFSNQLPLKSRTVRIMKEVMLLREVGPLQLFGKTGWSITEVNNGWFVGYLTEKSKDEPIYFAANVQPKEFFDMSNFGKSRYEAVYQSLGKLGYKLDLPN